MIFYKIQNLIEHSFCVYLKNLLIELPIERYYNFLICLIWIPAFFYFRWDVVVSIYDVRWVFSDISIVCRWWRHGVECGARIIIFVIIKFLGIKIVRVVILHFLNRGKYISNFSFGSYS